MKSIRLAEWVSLILSSILILALVGYLVVQMPKDDQTEVQFSIRVRKDQVTVKQGKALVPVEVHNESHKTVQQLKVKVLEFDLEIDYLPAGGKDTFFVLLEENQIETLKVELLFYRLE